MDSPAPGVDGFLALAWSKYNFDTNFLIQFQGLSKVPITNFQFLSEQVDSSDMNSLYRGYLIIGQSPNETTTKDFFLAGEVDVDAQIETYGYTSITTLSKQEIINPFLDLPLGNLQFEDP